MPIQDFWNYHALAAFSAQGLSWAKMFEKGILNTYIVFPHALNISNIYSYLLILFGQSFFVLQMFNCFCTFIDMILIYMIISHCFSNSFGVAASLIFYCIPAYWLYSSLLNGVESLFLTCLLIVCWLIICDCQKKNTKPLSVQVVYLSLMIIFTIIANMIRPIMFIWLLIILIFATWMGLTNHNFLKDYCLKIFIYTTIVALSIIGSTEVYSCFYGIPIAPSKVSIAYTLATGTNYDSKGTFAQDISDIQINGLKGVKKDNLNAAYSNIEKKLNKRLHNNLIELKGRRLIFLKRKLQSLSNETYGYNWVLFNLSSRSDDRHKLLIWRHMSNVLKSLSNYYFQIILLLAFIGTLFGFFVTFKHNRLNKYIVFSSLMLNGFELSSLITEVQDRYHIITYLPILFFSILGIHFCVKEYGTSRN